MINFKILKSYYLIYLLIICLSTGGCKYQTKVEPKDIFESFITAIYSKDKEAILSFIHPNSRDVFSTELEQQIKWYESLQESTQQSKPKFSKLEWIKRGSLVKVIYTHSENLEDYLPMIFQEGKWWIDFGINGNKATSFREIESYTPSK